MIVVPPTTEGLALAAAAIHAGEVVAYPTETVYGLAVDPFNESALQRLFDAKGRSDTNPVLLIVSDDAQLSEVTDGVGPARRYMEAFWPGPLSLLFPRNPRLPLAVTSGGATVCVRCPKCDVARALCRRVGTALTSTSANYAGESPALSVDQIHLLGVSLAIDGGRLSPSAPSTILDPATGKILRHGAISDAAIRAIERGGGGG